MANKYCVWNSSDNLNKDFEYDRCYNYNEMDFWKSGLFVGKQYVYKDGCIINNLTEYDMKILLRLSVNGAMTANQLRCFIALNTGDRGMDYILYKLDKLYHVGLIKETKYHKVYVDANIICEDDNRYIRMYELSNRGKRFVEIMNVSVYRDDDIEKVINKHTLLELHKLNCLWNTVIINQLRYNKNLKYFRINSIVDKRKNSRVKAPLVINTSKRTYIFEYVWSDSKIDKTIDAIKQKWFNYIENDANNITLVTVFKDRREMFNNKEILSNAYGKKVKIFCALQEDWNENPGCLYCYITIDGKTDAIRIEEL